MKLFITFLIFSLSFKGFCQYFPKKQLEKDLISFNLMGLEDSIYESKKIISYALRKSAKDYFSDKNSKLAKKGALFAYTKPKDKASSIAINASLIMAFSKVAVSKKDTLVKYIKSTVAPYIQFDKNTLIDNEQSNLLTGIGFTNNLINYKKFKQTYGVERKRFNMPIKVTGSFRKDYENDLEAFQSSILFLPRLFEINKKEELTRANWLGNQEFFDFDVNLGLEYDYRFNSKTVSLNGNLLRTISSTKLQIKPSKEFVTSLDWHYRYVLANSTSIENKDFSLLVFKIEYKPKIRTKKGILNNMYPSIGLIHENGENPTNGFNNQSFWALSLSLKI